MHITWVTRSFLDYRIPVYAALNELCGGSLTVIYNGDVVPDRCKVRLKAVLGERAVALGGETCVCGQKIAPISTCGRRGVRIPLQPGLLRACRESVPDAVVSDGFFQWTYAALWMRMRHGVWHVMCYEPTRHTERNAQWYRTAYRRLASHWIDAICCNGILCQEYCRDVLHIPQNRLYSGQMAADSELLARKCSEISDAEEMRFRRTCHLEGKRVLLFAGRLVEVKGVRQLLEAWNGAGLRNMALLCVGDGPQAAELKEYSRANEIPVYFAGEADYDSMAIYYRSADLLIIPTLQDNWSLVVPEAMACGLPIACSKYNGCWPELVTQANGWVFDPLDRGSTVGTLRKIEETESEALRRMGQKSRMMAAEYSPENAARVIFSACSGSHKR